jgi:hypothetical protein
MATHSAWEQLIACAQMRLELTFLAVTAPGSDDRVPEERRVLSWYGRGVPLGSVGYREASTKASQYA